jgi:hypothetical protein
MSIASAQSMFGDRKVLLWYVATVAFIALLFYMLVGGQGTVVLALLMMLFLGMTLHYSRVAGILVTLGYVMFMGDLRRLRDVILPHPSVDMLILVGPLVAIYLGLPQLPQIKLRDWLSKAMLGLLVLMILEVFNPLQGGLSVGLGGALFYICPVLWFWTGRQYGSPKAVDALIYKVFMPICLLEAVLGLYQNFIGFLPWEQAWIDANKTTFAILDLGGGHIRSFGFAVSPSEYSTLLSMGAAVSLASLLSGRRIWGLAFPLLAAGMFMASSRGVVIKLVFATVLAFVFRKSDRLKGLTTVRLIIFLPAGLLLLSYAASRFAPQDDNPSVLQSNAEIAFAHQAGGLANPFDERKSTAGQHATMIANGVMEGIQTPVGRGLGFTTEAESKFGGGGFSSEVDFSNMFASLGVVGGLLYFSIAIAVLMNCVTYLRIVPREVSLPVLAIITVGLGSWLIGGQYSTAYIWMFVIGGLVYHRRESAGLGITASSSSIGRTQQYSLELS